MSTAQRPPVVLLLGGDLMLETHTEAAARVAGCGLLPVHSLGELRAVLSTEHAVAAVADLTDAAFPPAETPSVLKGAPGGPIPTLGFYPHVLKDVGRRAEECGYEVVVPRSRFMGDTAALLRGLLARRSGE